MTQFNDIRGYSLFTRGGYKCDRGTNPAQSDRVWGGGAYKIGLQNPFYWYFVGIAFLNATTYQ